METQLRKCTEFSPEQIVGCKLPALDSIYTLDKKKLTSNDIKLQNNPHTCRSTHTPSIENNSHKRQQNQNEIKQNKTTFCFHPEGKQSVVQKIKQPGQKRLNKTIQDAWESSYRDNNRTKIHTAIHHTTADGSSRSMAALSIVM